MPKRKTKYTMRADGLIVLTEVIEGRRKYFYGHSDREVEQKRDAYKEQLHAVPVVTFESVADAWWEKHQDDLSPNTLHGYVIAKKRCVDEFGPQDITQISVPDLIAFLQSLAVKGFSQKVISNTRSILKQIFDFSILNGIMQFNPVVSLPIIKGKPKAPRQAAPDEEIKIIEKTKTESMGARMSYFMLWTGCRRGEAAALQQKHINLANHTARIEQAIAYGDNSRKPILKSTKTAAGTRIINLPDNVIEILPVYDDPETYIFFPAGLPTKTRLEKTLRQYQDAHGLTATAHQLRHSYASMLALAGVDLKTAQSLLGHSSITMTADIYQHVNDSGRTAALEKINEYAAK